MPLIQLQKLTLAVIVLHHSCFTTGGPHTRNLWFKMSQQFCIHSALHSGLSMACQRATGNRSLSSHLYMYVTRIQFSSPGLLLKSANAALSCRGKGLFQQSFANVAATNMDLHTEDELSESQIQMSNEPIPGQKMPRKSRAKSVQLTRETIDDVVSDLEANSDPVVESQLAEDSNSEVVDVSYSIFMDQESIFQNVPLIIGVDPDVSGAMAVLQCMEGKIIKAEVIDVPFVSTKVGKQMRKRHDAYSIASIVQNLNPPKGSVAFVEHSLPFPTDGKQSWYGAGYGYGIWVGILSGIGLNVVPVTARKWKIGMCLSGKQFTKDDSRALAGSIFPMVAPQLKRKKDHGRAEALLIAAWGKGYRRFATPLPDNTVINCRNSTESTEEMFEENLVRFPLSSLES